MAWNEPGGNSGGKRNPWGGGNRPEQGPPDLDEVLRNLQRRLSALFGGASGGRGTPSVGAGGRGFSFGTIAIILLVVWGLTGFYQVDAAERGLVFRFGKHVETTMPGPRWHLPWPIETKQVVNIQTISSFSDKTRMLTADENLVEIDLEVQYRRTNPLDYAFNVFRPDQTLEEVSESAIRETVGRSTLDNVLESGRQEIVERTKDLIQRRVQDAQAYRAAVVAEAEGESQRFLKVLTEYERAPRVTRDRLYLETVERVMASSKKVVLDTKGAGNLVYLPIDKLLEQQTRRAPAADPVEATMTVERSAIGSSQGSENRTRGAR